MTDWTMSEAERLRIQTDASTLDTDAVFTMDEDSFRAFYDRTARAVWSYLVRLTGDRQLADDLLQDAYYRFLRANAQYENDTHRRNALFRIATNLARDAHRRRRARPPHESPDEQQLPAGDDPGGAFERRTDLARALEHLKPRERSLLWLAYAEGSSHREIAGVLGVKTGSVKLLLFRARRRLASLLGSPGGRDGAR